MLHARLVSEFCFYAILWCSAFLLCSVYHFWMLNLVNEKWEQTIYSSFVSLSIVSFSLHIEIRWRFTQKRVVIFMRLTSNFIVRLLLLRRWLCVCACGIMNDTYHSMFHNGIENIMLRAYMSFCYQQKRNATRYLVFLVRLFHYIPAAIAVARFNGDIKSTKKNQNQTKQWTGEKQENNPKIQYSNVIS